MKASHFSPGFTLFEILLVLSLVGILSILALSPFSIYQDEQKLNTTALELASALRFSRSESQRTGRPVSVVIDPEAEIFSVMDETTGDLRYHPLSKQPYICRLASDSFIGGVDIVSAGGGSTAITVAFYPDGRPKKSGDTQILLSYAGFTQTVTVTETTGRIIAY